MSTLSGTAAIEDALHHGRALMKFISANDVGATGAHQSGFYLPKAAWRLFTINPPIEGENSKHDVKIVWPDGRTTESVVSWYGQGTRSEYRLTRFGREFPYFREDLVGSLLVIVPRTITEFAAHVLETEEDIEDIQVTLGVEIIRAWGVLAPSGSLEACETPASCIAREFAAFVEAADSFPKGLEFTAKALQTLEKCRRDFVTCSPDERLMHGIESEYALFKAVEAKLCTPDIRHQFGSVDEFLSVAHTIINRRKSRAGRSLENHVGAMLQHSRIPHVVRGDVRGEPDIVIPSLEALRDSSVPRERIFVVGVKTTCKDRWRQVIHEGENVTRHYILTLQQGISASMLRQMQDADVSLVVPEPLHKHYPPDRLVDILTLARFVETIRNTLPA